MKKFKEFLKERMSKVSKNQKGFSLVELIIVIAILGIIAAIALPNVTGAVNNSRRSTDVTNAKAIANAFTMALAKDDVLASEVHTATNPASAATTELKINLGASDLASTSAKVQSAISTELNGNIPKTAYKISADTKVYILTIKPDGTIVINAGKVDGTTEAIVYPVPADVYTSK